MRAWAMPFAIIPTAVVAQLSPPVPPANPPANCTAPEHRQFDFWIGDWEVFLTAKPEQKVGGSLIESVYNGCGIRENWMPFTLSTGGSLNSYDPKAGVWRQTWLDSGNHRVEFVGTLQDGRMVLTSLPAADGGLTRMTFSVEPGGAVRQLGQVSGDGGKTWSLSFDFTYRRRRR